MTEQKDELDWLVPGAQVTVYAEAGMFRLHGVRWQWTGVRRSTVERVTPTGFRVTGEPFLIRKDSLRGVGDYGDIRVAVPGSELEARVLAEWSRRKAHQRARQAVEAWLKEPTHETHAVAVDALTRWEGGAL